MKKLLLLLFIIFLSCQSFSQFGDRFNYISKENVEGYARPLATSAGMILNSAAFHTAEIPTTFGFTFGIYGMYVMIPESQRSFTPKLTSTSGNTEATATIYGDKGTAYVSPNGYQVFPSGIGVTSFPAGMLQAGFQLMKSELLIRYVPDTKVSDDDKKVGLFGVGVKHQIDQYLPFIPLNVAVQFLYNKFEITDLVTLSTWALNLQASKRFAILGIYGALQYENATMDVDYTYKGDNGSQDVRVKTNFNGDNNFRFIIGAALHLGIFHINADANFSAQTILTTGFTFNF